MDKSNAYSPFPNKSTIHENYQLILHEKYVCNDDKLLGH